MPLASWITPSEHCLGFPLLWLPSKCPEMLLPLPIFHNLGTQNDLGYVQQVAVNKAAIVMTWFVYIPFSFLLQQCIFQQVMSKS